MSLKWISPIFVLILALGYSDCNDGIRHYNGYSVIRLIPKTETQVNYLRELEENVVELDFWRGPSYVDRAVDVMIPPHLNQTFDKIFKAKNFEKSVLIKELEETLIEERAVRPLKPLKKKPSRNNGTKADIVPDHFNDYQRLAKVHSFLDAIVAQYPAIAGVESIGTTYGNRDLKLIRIGEGQDNKNKPVIFMEGGIHAREWISPATLQCFAQELVQRSSSDAVVKDLLKKFDFYILPVLNADGYEYSHTNDRMWRKTRQPHSSCYGADPNRNFGHKWGGAGASTNPCSETYRGPNAFSEKCTKAVETFVLPIKDRVKAYFAVHSYGQYWLYPWGYTSALTPDDKDLNRLAKIAVGALTPIFNTKYTIGTSTNVLYAAAGGADDWSYGAAGVKYSYTVELRDRGSYGFVLPKSQIRPTCQETTAGFIAFAQQLATEIRNN